MTHSDPELIARVLLEDDRDAFGELVARHQSAVRRYLRHLTRGDAALADDLAQETFVQAYRSLARYRADSSFSTWLLGIAHNHWRNARRRRDASPVARPAGAPEEPAVGDTTALTDLRHDLELALQRLSPDEQHALHLSYQQGLSHREIAAVLGCPIGTAKTYLARSKDKLRTLLSAWNPQT